MKGEKRSSKPTYFTPGYTQLDNLHVKWKCLLDLELGNFFFDCLSYTLKSGTQGKGMTSLVDCAL